MADLGTSPPSNAFKASAEAPERHYPLRVLVCDRCWLVQTDLSLFELGYDGLFTDDYPYFSSTSKGWVEHAREFVERITEREHLDSMSLVVEVGANDGYLLQHVKCPCYGVEPTRTGDKAREKGITIYPQFFTAAWAENAAQMGRADVMIANNVLAHVPDINDFVRGFANLLKPTGVAAFEFPHLLNLVQKRQFDTIYHEHYSYLSLTAVQAIFHANGLEVVDVEELPTHGGSLRVYAAPIGSSRTVQPSVHEVMYREQAQGVAMREFYEDFQVAIEQVKDDFMRFLLRAKALGRTVVGFGAAAKGNTLLNYAGVRSDLMAYVVDDTPAKQGKYLPGSGIEVRSAFDGRPDYVVVLPWNFRAEIEERLKHLSMWGTKLVYAIPQLEIA